MTLIAFTFLLVVSAWVYSDARSRNSSHPALWALGVFALLIVFLPLYLIMRPPKSNIVVTRSAPNLCPHCGKYYEPPVKFCPNCGNKLHDVMKKNFPVVLILAAVIIVGCKSVSSKVADEPIQTSPIETKAEQPEEILNLGITIEDFETAFNRTAVERNVPQLVLNDVQFFDNGEKIVQKYPAGLYLFGVVDKKNGFLKEVTVCKEFLLNRSERQSEAVVAGITFLIAVAALKPELSSDERAEILNKLSRDAKNSSVVMNNTKYSSLLFDNGKSLALSIRAGNSK